MEYSIRRGPGRAHILLNRVKTFITKPQNGILLLLGIILTVSTIAPMVSIFVDTVTVHLGSVDAHYTGLTEGYTLYNWQDLFFGRMSQINLWTPLLNSILLSVFSCIFAILYGGIFAYLVTRHQSCLPQIPELDFYISLYYAAVDAGCRMAERVFQQRRHRHVGWPSCRVV